MNNRTSQQGSDTFEMILAGLLGFLCGWIVAGSPSAVLAGQLLADTDYPNAAAAFEFFKRDTWHWPLGENPAFGGVNIFFSDGAPWFALVAKALVSLGLPAPDLHALILVNFALFGGMAYRLSAMIAVNRQARWVATCLLASSLIMPVRLIGAQHIALSSYWVLLWAMTVVPMQKDPKAAAFFRRWEFLATLTIATWSHAYLAAMAASIIIGCLLLQRRFAAVPLALAWPSILLWAIGAFAPVSTRLNGAKAFGLDILALGQSMNWSIIPAFYPVVDAQGDSFLFLGVGCWFLLLTGGLSLIFSPLMRQSLSSVIGPDHRRQWALLAVNLMLYGFGTALNLRVAGKVLIDVDIPTLLAPLYENFRAVGRFGIPLAYLVVALSGIMAVAAARLRPLFWSLPLLAISLQAADLVHAGRRSPSSWQREEVVLARKSLTSLLQGSGWTGRVYRRIDEEADLEKQQLLDYLLTGAGATEFRLVHSARRSAEQIRRRNGILDAGAGDLLISANSYSSASCVKEGRFKDFSLCILQDAR